MEQQQKASWSGNQNKVHPVPDTYHPEYVGASRKNEKLCRGVTSIHLKKETEMDPSNTTESASVSLAEQKGDIKDVSLHQDAENVSSHLQAEENSECSDDGASVVKSSSAYRRMSNRTVSTTSIITASTASSSLTSSSSADLSLATAATSKTEAHPTQFKARTDLDAEIQKYKEIVERGRNSFHEDDITKALDAEAQLEALLPLCEKVEYTPATKLQAQISELKRKMKELSLSERLPLARHLGELESRYREEIEARKALYGPQEQIDSNTKLFNTRSAALELSAPPIKLCLQMNTEKRSPEQSVGANYDAQCTRGEHRFKRRDCLVVLQAAPLVWVDFDGNLHPLPPPDFDTEKKNLREAVGEAKALGLGEIDLVFEEATTKGLGNLLATGRSRVLHFSCDGQPEYLGLENKGAMQALSVDKLRGYIAAGGEQLQLVFVSACHSRPAGEAFLAAGVKHIICCKTKEQLEDTAATIFAQSFYTALACGKHLRASFELARQAVLVSPCVLDSRAEMNKFLLLPEKPDDDPYHDVPIFYTSPTRYGVQVAQSMPCPRRTFPPQPQLFLGQEVTMYEILQGLQNAALVKVGGPSGSGKAGIVKSVLNYLYDLSRMFAFDHFYWAPTVHCSPDDVVSKDFQKLFELLKKDELHHEVGELKDCCGRMVASLYEARALVVIDARELNKEGRIKKLDSFIKDLIMETRHVRAIVICPAERDIAFSTRCHTAHVTVPPLDKRSSVLMFGNLCRFVQKRRFPGLCSSEKLSELLVPDPQEIEYLANEAQSERCLRIFTLIGEGNPARIHEAATKMTEEDYIELIRLGVGQLENYIIPHFLKRGQGSSTSGETRELKDVVEGLLALLNGLPTLYELEQLHKELIAIRKDKQVPSIEPRSLSTGTKSSSSIAFLGEIVGVEISGANMDGNHSWNDYIVSNKTKIELLLQKLGRHGSLIHGGTEISVERIEKNGVERAVVGLECEIDLQKDLEAHEYKRVREICRKIADHLEEAGATQQELDRIMIGAAWKGSVYLLLEAPSSICNMLFSEILRLGKLGIDGFENVKLVSIVPAFMVTGVFSRLLDVHNVSTNHKKVVEAVIWKEQNLQR